MDASVSDREHAGYLQEAYVIEMGRELPRYNQRRGPRAVSEEALSGVQWDIEGNRF